jgi:hypothetical protein
MKKNNPWTPIMIREASNIQPRVYARYEFGKEKGVSLEGKFLPLQFWKRVFGFQQIKSLEV